MDGALTIPSDLHLPESLRTLAFALCHPPFPLAETVPAGRSEPLPSRLTWDGGTLLPASVEVNPVPYAPD
jgi:hypothetical protein